MRIHTDTLTFRDIYAAAEMAGDGVRVKMTSHGSRSRDHAFNVSLTGTSTRRPNSGTRGVNSDDYAATWDEWGMFLAELFNRDPEMVAGSYKDREHFRYCTNNRYDSLTPASQHGGSGHRWEFSGIPREFNCTTCDAIRRH